MSHTRTFNRTTFFNFQPHFPDLHVENINEYKEKLWTFGVSWEERYKVKSVWVKFSDETRSSRVRCGSTGERKALRLGIESREKTCALVLDN